MRLVLALLFLSACTAAVEPAPPAPEAPDAGPAAVPTHDAAPPPAADAATLIFCFRVRNTCPDSFDKPTCSCR